MKKLQTKTKVTLCVLLVIIILPILMIVGRACSWAGKAADVVAAELDPAYLLQKYEWFKNTAAQ